MACNPINRWRHRHGFGVHSPFAYEMILDVVSPSRGYAYYMEEEIDCLDLPTARRRVMKRHCRLVNFLRRHGLSDPAEGAEMLEKGSTLHFVNPSAEVRRDVHDFLEPRGGLILSAKDYIIAVPRRDMAFQCYEL